MEELMVKRLLLNIIISTFDITNDVARKCLADLMLLDFKGRKQKKPMQIVFALYESKRQKQ